MIPTITYCEENVFGLIAQPANSWSNLIYIFIGFYIYLISRKNRNILLKIFPIFVILIGVFSFIYHASYSFVGQFLDLASMFLFSSFLIVLNIKRLVIKLSIYKILLIYVLINIVSLLFVYFQQTVGGFNIGIPIFILQIIAILFLEYLISLKENYTFKKLLTAMLILLVAFVFWLLDYFRIWCNPQNFHLLNGHMLWHIINSFSFIFIYKFYNQFGLSKIN